MKDKRPRTHDLILLTAYLDNELTPPQRQGLEARLEHDSILRETLENMRKTKFILGGLPHLKAPRSFTLTPEMVSVRCKKQPPLFTALRLASSIAVVLLVTLVGIELIFSGGLGAGLMASQALETASDSVEHQESAEPLILWAEPGENEASAMGGGSDERVYSTDIESADNMDMEAEVAPMEEDLQSGVLSEEAETSKAVDEGEAESPILGLNPEEGGDMIERSESAIAEDEAGPGIFLGAFRWAQITLGVIAVAGLISLWVLRKKRQT